MADAQNILHDAITRIPVWTGDGKDTFTPVQWLARVEKARTTAAWTDAQTMSFVYVSLRGEALLWFDVLNRNPRGADSDDVTGIQNPVIDG